MILEDVVKYLAAKLNLTVGINAFWFEMPERPTKCIVVTEPKDSAPVLPQLNASSHYIKVTVREAGNTAAETLAKACYRWLLTDAVEYETADITGFVNLSEETMVYIQLYGSPKWEKSDQEGRKYFSFTLNLITTRI